MSRVVVDTHAAIWYLLNDRRLSPPAGVLLDRTTKLGDPILIASITLVEVIYLVEKGRIPASTQAILRTAIDDPDGPFEVAPLDENVANAVGEIDRRSIPDLPDRVIAATALTWNVPLISRDAKIRASQIETIW